jgi:hypothetical protein
VCVGGVVVVVGEVEIERGQPTMGTGPFRSNSLPYSRRSYDGVRRQRLIIVIRVVVIRP